MDLKICSFNCFSIRKNIEIVRRLINSHDIVFLQEIILTEDNIDLLNNIDPTVNCTAIQL